MPRALSPDEADLWRRATADLRGERPGLRRTAAPPPPMAATPLLRQRRPSGPGTTLDGGWDRRLKAGSVAPDRIVDLHGLGLDRAHVRIIAAIAEAAAAGDRLVLVVTGKPPRAGTSRLDNPLRGIIRASLGDWLAASAAGSTIAAVRPAHLRHGGAGALYVVLRRTR